MNKKIFLLNIFAAVLATALLLAACSLNGPSETEATDTLPELTLPNFGPDSWATDVPSGSPQPEDTEAGSSESLPEQTETLPASTPEETQTASVTESETETETATETETETETETAAAEGIALAAEDLPDNIWIFRRGKTYYLGAEKKPVNGLKTIGKQRYFFDKDGVMAQKQFVTVDKKLYYFGEDGAMLKNTKVGGYKIDADGVCTTDYSGRFTLTESNLNEYCDYLLQKYGSTPEAIFNFIWKNYGQRPNEPIGSLLNPTQHEINQMIIRFFNDGGGACCDYSYATGRLLERAGYKNVIVHCDPKQSRHQWNLVQIRPGVWRHIDTYRKAFKVFLKTDDELEELDTDNVPYRWDHTKWTSTTATGTGGKNPVKESEAPETTAPPETTEAPKPTQPQTTEAPPETTEAPKPTEPQTTQAPPETTSAAETTSEPEVTQTPATTEEPGTVQAPETSEASATTTAAPTTTAPPAEETTAGAQTTTAASDPEQPGGDGEV